MSKLTREQEKAMFAKNKKKRKEYRSKATDQYEEYLYLHNHLEDAKNKEELNVLENEMYDALKLDYINKTQYRELRIELRKKKDKVRREEL